MGLNCALGSVAAAALSTSRLIVTCVLPVDWLSNLSSVCYNYLYSTDHVTVAGILSVCLSVRLSLFLPCNWRYGLLLLPGSDGQDCVLILFTGICHVVRYSARHKYQAISLF